VCWTQKERKDWNDYTDRSTTNLDRLKALGVKYYPEIIGKNAGSWPEPVSTEPSVHSWDISKYISKAGPVKIAVQHKGGRNWLGIKWVSIEVDGKEVARDGDRSDVGPHTTNKIYSFDIKKYSPKSKIVFKAFIYGMGGTNVRGRVLVL